MPSKPKRLCKKQGCSNLTDEGYCTEHKRIKNKSKQNTNFWHSWYSSSRWRKVRLIFLSKNPICVKCNRPATVVDHIKDHKGDTMLFWDSSNWQALCKKCHDMKTYRTHRGRG